MPTANSAYNGVLTPQELFIYTFGKGYGMDVHSAEEMARTLEDIRKAQGEALIIGGIAVIHYGYQRYTHDTDLLYATHDEFELLRRLDKNFKLVLKSSSGWHQLEHRKTKVRLELIPEAGLTTYGFIPGPKIVSGEHGFISLFGLVWLKLVAGRMQDEADVVVLAKQDLPRMLAQRDKLPSEFHERFDQLMQRAKLEMANDPYRADRAEESAPKDARLKPKPAQRAKRKPAAKKGA